MFKVVTAYLYNQPGKQKMVVMDKERLDGAKEEFFETITLGVPLETIKEWYEEIDSLDIDEE